MREAGERRGTCGNCYSDKLLVAMIQSIVVKSRPQEHEAADHRAYESGREKRWCSAPLFSARPATHEIVPPIVTVGCPTST